ncbi:DUF4931 domain-containing protein [Anaerobacillus sp. MEB173]|uniref:DUF4931 domain-containing protein n=1 Tax=Anaerobacillus sp. MEB173 TaxID=3383345 RepID=UPI003F8E58A3
MGIEFKKNEEWFTFFDGEGKTIERKTEIRFDPLTGDSSRLVFDPGMTFTAPDYSKEAEKTGGKNCPFCSENVLKMTPVFPKEVAEDGRITVGEAILFPNLFPYSKHNGVVIFSDAHYVRLEQFTETMMKDAFMAAQTYIQRVMEQDEKAKYASINWNYLPYSGGSILHPHMHIIISETPTTYQHRVKTLVNDYIEKHGSSYFVDLCNKEKELGDRWIGEKGNVAWMHAFAPKTHNDFLTVLPNITSLEQISEQDWIDFARSLKAIFATMSEQGLASFNMLLNVSKTDGKQPIHGQLIPRLTIGQLGTSDINYFQSLHQEALSYKIPEEIAKKAREQFNKQ